MMPRIHLVGNHILNRQAFKKQFNGSIVKASESIQNLYPITIRYKGAGSLHIHRKTMNELATMAVLGNREQPNYAHNFVTHKHCY